jgi:hypothetical protein
MKITKNSTKIKSNFLAFCSSFCTLFIPARAFLAASLNFSETSRDFGQDASSAGL